MTTTRMTRKEWFAVPIYWSNRQHWVQKLEALGFSINDVFEFEHDDEDVISVGWWARDHQGRVRVLNGQPVAEWWKR